MTLEKLQTEITAVDFETVNKAATTLASAFANDPTTFIALPDPDKRANLAPIIAYDLKLEILSGGKVYATSPECEGVACWHKSGIKTTWANKLRAGLLRLPSYGGAHYLRFSSEEGRFYERLRRQYAPKHYMYLALLGVDPKHQGKGHASKLIRHMLCHADRQNLPCYVETQNARNINMYTNFGFKLRASTYFPEGSKCEVHIMLREPVT
jgi:ribosomal protein S18 acetylase RimI-like enzyme